MTSEQIRFLDPSHLAKDNALGKKKKIMCVSGNVRQMMFYVCMSDEHLPKGLPLLSAFFKSQTPSKNVPLVD